MPTVVAGYDASPASRAAVEHAIRRAGRGGKVIVVHAYQVPAEYIGAPYYKDLMDKATERANVVLDELEQECAPLGTVEHELDAVEGAPAEVLCRVASHRGADEIVLGTRGVGRVRALVGSVAHDVLHLAHCPVLVIPERAVEAHHARGSATAAAA